MSEQVFEREQSTEVWNGSEASDSSQDTLTSDIFQGQTQTRLSTNGGYEVGYNDQSQRGQTLGYSAGMGSSTDNHNQEGTAQDNPTPASEPNNYSIWRYEKEDTSFSQLTLGGRTTRASNPAVESPVPDEVPVAINNRNGTKRAQRERGGKLEQKEHHKKKGTGSKSGDKSRHKEDDVRGSRRGTQVG